MTVIEQVAEHFKSKIGQKSEEHLGEVMALMIQRYALAIDDHNPVYHDRLYAQKLGYTDIIAPPNMLASNGEWQAGAKEKDLRLDGLPEGERLPPRLDSVRLMGGGEKMEFHKPVVAGTNVTLITEVSDAYVKEGRKGLIAFVVFTKTFKDENGDTLCTSNRTIIAR